jgi:hypothetical protein
MKGAMKRICLFLLLVLIQGVCHAQERGTFVAKATAALEPCSVTNNRLSDNGSGKSGMQNPPDRYLLLGRHFMIIQRTGRGELDEAATAGYRVLAAVARRFTLLEKVARPPDTYKYMFVEDIEEMKRAGAEGFRLVPLVRAWRGDRQADYEQAFLMEKPPGPNSIWSYSTVRLTPESCIVRLTLGEAYFYGHHRDTVAIYETPGRVMPVLRQLDPELQPPPSGESTSVTNKREQYRFLRADTFAELDGPLRLAAGVGYRVVAASDGSIELLAEKRLEEGKGCEYLIVAARKASTMQRKLNDAGRQGFRLIPAAIGTYMKPYFIDMGTETYAVMEKCTSGDPRFEYRLATGQSQLNKASLKGYEAVGMKEFEFHDGVIFLERPLRK